MLESLAFDFDRLQRALGEEWTLCMAKISTSELLADALVVGGAPRNALLGLPVRDLDLSLPDDATEVVRGLESSGVARIRALYPRWRTAEIEIESRRLSIASMRGEIYSRPGGVPQLTFSTDLAADLVRRDFRVNTVAVPVQGGQAVAIQGAVGDFTTRQLVELHSRTYFDDPSRLLRGARYQVFCELTWPDSARQLRQEAIEGGALEHLSPVLLRKEVDLAFAPPLDSSGCKGAEVLAVLHRWGLLQRLAPPLAWDRARALRWRKIDSHYLEAEISEPLSPRARREVLWMLLMEDLDPVARRRFVLASGMGSEGSWLLRIGSQRREMEACVKNSDAVQGLSLAERTYLRTLSP